MTPPRARPTLAVSLGDPAGIGPEVVLEALARMPGPGKPVAPADDAGVDADVVVVGDARVIAAAARRLGLPLPTDLHSPPAVACDPARLFEGRPSAEGGRAAAAAVRAAVELVRSGRADALVTAPLNKEALGLAGEPWPGHTELLGDLLDAPRVKMMLQGGGLRVVLVTTHLALADVPRAVTADLVVETCEVASAALEGLLGRRPRLALAALNPHAGDGGRFGREDELVLAPAVARARAAGLDVTGPHPADTLFARALRPGSGVDAVIACYHDQGLIPVKLVSFGSATNVSLGLPIVRTSPDHGTAYDIAGQGVAEPDAFIQAMRVAVELVRRR